MPHAFSQRLAAGALLCDGAMGTMLYARGVSLDACFDVLNLNNPRLVQAIHADYVAAGADLIETNTFGANRFKLAVHGLEGQVREVNRRGVRLARDVRESTGRDVLILGSVGPLGKYLAPLGSVTAEDARAAFREQAEGLLEGGVDAFIVETFSDLAEIALAIEAIRSVTDLPIAADHGGEGRAAGSQASAAARRGASHGHGHHTGRRGVGRAPDPASRDAAPAQARGAGVRRHRRARPATGPHRREARPGRQAPQGARRRNRARTRRLARPRADGRPADGAPGARGDRARHQYALHLSRPEPHGYPGRLARRPRARRPKHPRPQGRPAARG